MNYIISVALDSDLYRITRVISLIWVFPEIVHKART